MKTYAFFRDDFSGAVQDFEFEVLENDDAATVHARRMIDAEGRQRIDILDGYQLRRVTAENIRLTP